MEIKLSDLCLVIYILGYMCYWNMETRSERGLKGLSEENVESKEWWLQDRVIQPDEVYRDIYL